MYGEKYCIKVVQRKSVTGEDQDTNLKTMVQYSLKTNTTTSTLRSRRELIGWDSQKIKCSTPTHH